MKLTVNQGGLKTSKITISFKHLAKMVLSYIYIKGIRRKKIKFQIFSFQGHNLKNLNKSENSSCLKVPDVGIQNDRTRTMITTHQTIKRSEFVGPRKRPKTVQFCTTHHYDQILQGFSQFLSPANSDLFFACCVVIMVRMRSF